jgi:hypothetical protein
VHRRQLCIAGDARNVVHINLVLVQADGPDAAFHRALELGKQAEATYDNPDGQQVTVMFRGLRDLHMIHDALEHGAELLYEEQIGLAETDLAKLVRPKAQLAVFRAAAPRTGPTYAAADIMAELPVDIERPATDE